MNIVKGFFSGALGIVIFVGFIFLSALTLIFGIRVVEFIYPLIGNISTFTFYVSLIILLPLAIFRKTRAFSAYSLLIASFIFGASLWLYSFLVTYTYWGIFGLVLAFFLAGIGVTPVAILASIFHLDWATVGNLVFGLVITFGARFLAIYLGEKVDKMNNQNQSANYVQAENAIYEDISINKPYTYPTSIENLRDVIDIVSEYKTISISDLQKRMNIGYAHASKLIDELIDIGLVEDSSGTAPRNVYSDRIKEFLLTTNIQYLPYTKPSLGIGKSHEELLKDSASIIIDYEKASASLLQRKLGIGYSRAAVIMDNLETLGIVSPTVHDGIRNVLIRNKDQALKLLPKEQNNENKIGLLIVKTLEAFGIRTRLAEVNTKRNGIEYCFEVEVGSSIENLPRLEKDIALAVASPTGKVKIQAPIPGRNLIGILIPNRKTN